MLKKLELMSPTSCLNKAGPLEPIFVLRAKDPLFHQTVTLWAAMAVDVHEGVKVAEALNLAKEGREYRAHQWPEAEASK